MTAGSPLTTSERDALSPWLVVLVVVASVAGLFWYLGSREWGYETEVGVARAGQRFAESGVDSYVIDVERICFCFDGWAARIRVEDGTITRLTELEYPSGVRGGGRVVAGVSWDRVPRDYRWIESWGPVDRAFAEVLAHAGDGDTGGFSFDRDTGLPRTFQVDGDGNTTDDELTVRWSRFRPIS
jgi:hypothetical protein